MSEFAWTFARGDEDRERLTIVRDEGGGSSAVRLAVTVGGATRTYDFADVMAAVRFQCDMEAFLLKSGWSFIGFAPERRMNRDRRGFPRIRERRRWWTDGTVPTKQLLGRDDFHWLAEHSRAGRKRDDS